MIISPVVSVLRLESFLGIGARIGRRFNRYIFYLFDLGHFKHYYYQQCGRNDHLVSDEIGFVCL